MIDFGDFELSRSLIPIGGLAPLAQAYPTLAPVINKYSTEAPVVATLEGKSKIAFGYNIGVLFTVSPKVNIGISYRSKVHMDVNEGTATLKYAGDDLKAVIAHEQDRGGQQSPARDHQFHPGSFQDRRRQADPQR